MVWGRFGFGSGSVRGHSWVAPGSLRGHFGGRFGINLASIWDRFRTLLNHFCDTFGSSLGKFWEHVGTIFGQLFFCGEGALYSRSFELRRLANNQNRALGVLISVKEKRNLRQDPRQTLHTKLSQENMLAPAWPGPKKVKRAPRR